MQFGVLFKDRIVTVDWDCSVYWRVTLPPRQCSCLYCSWVPLWAARQQLNGSHFEAGIPWTHLSLSRMLFLELLSARPLGNTLWGSRTTTWGFSRKPHPLWTPTWSLRSWMTTILSVPSGPGCFWKLLEQLLTNHAELIKRIIMWVFYNYLHNFSLLHMSGCFFSAWFHGHLWRKRKNNGFRKWVYYKEK